MMDARNNIFDAIKALAIWLVVLGHCVQYLCGLDYWNNPLFQLIYSFHMPLFFMVSGFFFTSSIKLSIWEFLRKKGLSLLLPCFVWGIVYSCMHFQSWEVLAKDIFIPIHWPFWFLKGLFLVQLVVYVSMRMTGANGGGQIRHLLFAVLISLSVYAMPYMGVPRVMIPIFWLGYIMKMYYEQYMRYHRVIGLVALIVFVGLYYFWNGETMHYSASASVTLYHVVLGKHGYTMLNLVHLGYRILLGVAGSIVVISVLHEMKNVNRYVAMVGASTAGIYILQSLIIEKGMNNLFERYISMEVNGLVLYIGLVLMSILLVIIITGIYQLMRRNETIDLVLFGCVKKTKRTAIMS